MSIRERAPLALTVMLASAAVAHAQEVVGPWTIVQVPASATLVSGGVGSWDWLNVLNNPVSVNDAFSGPGLTDDGYANGSTGTTIELTFTPPVVNGPTDDLVLFDAQFDQGAYDVAADHDGFAAVTSLPIAAFVDTLVMPSYWYGSSSGGPYPAGVFGAPIELSDIGVPAGATVTKVRFTLTNGGGDPLGMGVPCPPVAAAEVERLGTPPNPSALRPGVTSGPVFGSTWNPFVSHASFMPGAVIDLLGVSTGMLNFPAPPFGTLLCDVFSLALTTSASAGQPFAIQVPSDCTVIGVQLCAQAASIDLASNVALTNALDLTIGSF